jgi:hypothetical protein
VSFAHEVTQFPLILSDGVMTNSSKSFTFLGFRFELNKSESSSSKFLHKGGFKISYAYNNLLVRGETKYQWLGCSVLELDYNYNVNSKCFMFGIRLFQIVLLAKAGSRSKGMGITILGLK